MADHLDSVKSLAAMYRTWAKRAEAESRAKDAVTQGSRADMLEAGAAAAGAARIPCVFRDVKTPQEASIFGWPYTFDLAMLESANPPTLHHFASGQAHPVNLIEKTRIVQVSVLDWVAPDY